MSAFRKFRPGPRGVPLGSVAAGKKLTVQLLEVDGTVLWSGTVGESVLMAIPI